MSEAFDNRPDETGKRTKGKRAKVASLKSARTSARQRAADASISSWKGVGVGVLLLVLCVALGVQSAKQSQRMRALYSELQKDQADRDKLLAQRSRLLIERGALNSYNSAEKLASEKLGMRFPETITRVEKSAVAAVPESGSNPGAVR